MASQVDGSGCDSATSSWARLEASGLRSSWEASATNRRCRWAERCSRSSMAFMVWAKRPTSSLTGGSPTRRSSEAVSVMAATWARMTSTGRSARPTSSHTRNPASRRTPGAPQASARRSSCTVSSACNISVATMTLADPAGVCPVRTTTRKLASGAIGGPWMVRWKTMRWWLPSSG